MPRSALFKNLGSFVLGFIVCFLLLNIGMFHQGILNDAGSMNSVTSSKLNLRNPNSNPEIKSNPEIDTAAMDLNEKQQRVDIESVSKPDPRLLQSIDSGDSQKYKIPKQKPKSVSSSTNTFSKLKNQDNSMWASTGYFEIFSKIKVASDYDSAIVGYLSPNTDPISYAIFCGCIRATKELQKTDLVVFADTTISKQLKEISMRFDVSLLMYNSAELTPEYMREFHPSSLVWLFFNYLYHQKDSVFSKVFKAVFVADVENIAVQTNPFELLSHINWRSSSAKDISSSPTSMADSAASALFTMGDFLGRKVGAKPELSEVLDSCFGGNIRFLMSEVSWVKAEMLIGDAAAIRRYSALVTSIMSGSADLGKGFPHCAGRAGGHQELVSSALINAVARFGLMERVLQVGAEDVIPVVDFSSTSLSNFSAALRVDSGGLLALGGAGGGGGGGGGRLYVAAREKDQNDGRVPFAWEQVVVVPKWGSVPALVVRDYFRARPLHLQLARTHAYWLADSSAQDLEALIPDRQECGAFTLLDEQDILHGHCDLISVTASSVQQCCETCEELSKQRRFDMGVPGFAPGSPFSPPGASSPDPANGGGGGFADVANFLRNGQLPWDLAGAAGGAGAGQQQLAGQCSAFVFARVENVCYLKSCDKSEIKDLVLNAARTPDTAKVGAYMTRMSH